MKKNWILAILMAGVLTATAFSGCIGTEERKEEEPVKEQEIISEPLEPNDVLFTVKGNKAVLVIGGADKESNNARYWNDLIWMYDILIKKYNYSKENVCVLYADGENVSEDNCNDYESAVECALPINYPAKKKSLKEATDKLAANLKQDEQLYIWTNDHGTLGDVNIGHIPPNSAALCLWEENINDYEFAGGEYFGKVKNYSVRIIFMKQCFSGGFIDDLSAEKTIICTACTDLAVSWGGAGSGGYPYGVFAFYFQAALNQSYPDGTPAEGADANGDGRVSIKEAFDYAFQKEMEYGEGLTAVEVPQYDDNANKIGNDPLDGDLGSRTYL